MITAKMTSRLAARPILLALAGLLALPVLLGTWSPPAHACYQCTWYTGRPRCSSGFITGSGSCTESTKVGAHGEPFDVCTESGNCVLWILTLDTVDLGSSPSTTDGNRNLADDDELRTLTWMCADPFVGTDPLACDDPR